ncbi:hypothetical protein BcDW1_7590 [Botrytis cinerea BcDW1]|uniref:J domain-containing protein n=1 Tax=Botryotinia fuckeliana (strain BcDW1) TaxID=1290391 RepID=M7TR97_BOTF1|nr:hypothetical protein BcDW1_7590 [Botrytis cinerea BcDW1]
MSSSRDDIGSEQNKQQKQTPPIREHHDCTVIGRCKPHFQNLALPFLSQYPEYPRGAALPLMTCLKDPPPTNNTLIKLHFRTLGRILHPDKYSGYVKKSGPPPKSFLFFESQHPFDPKNPTLETPTTSPRKALHLVNLARQTLLDPFLRYEYEYEEGCTGIIGPFSMPEYECNRAKENGNPYIRNGWMDMKEREFKGWGRKPWFWEYEYGLGQTGLLAVGGGYGWMERFWIQSFPNFGERWGCIGGGEMREGRESADIQNLKIGSFGGDSVGVGVGETIVNVGHYYIDNFLPSSFSDWIWGTCEDFRKWRGYGFIGHYEIDPHSSKKIWKGSNGEWLAVREGESAGFGSSMHRMIATSPIYANMSSTLGGHCEGRIWWTWIPASAGGSGEST